MLKLHKRDKIEFYLETDKIITQQYFNFKLIEESNNISYNNNNVIFCQQYYF